MAEGRRDAFSAFHPAVNFIFFLIAIGFGVVVQHPVYLAAGLLGAAAYYFLLYGKKGAKLLLALLPVACLIALFNPLFNTRGDVVLFLLFGRPYTLEALLYGCAVGGMLLLMMLWFGCYSAVMTGDKFTSLFGNLIPSLSLLLVMIFRMVPELARKGRQITEARKCIGKGTGAHSRYRDKAKEGLTVLGCLTAWSLEGSIVTADSMKSRGYGCGKRTSFRLSRMTGRDWGALFVMTVLAAGFLTFAAMGSTEAAFTPKLSFAALQGWNILGFAAYCLYLLLPAAIHIEEAFRWRAWKSGI